VPLLLSDRLKSRLKVPHGTLYAGSGRKTVDLLKSAPDWGNPAKIISVGDVTTCNLIESGILPDICIVDHLTCRAEVSDEVKNCIRHPAYHEVTIKNPAGTITTDLVTAITDAMTCERPIRIFVQGEEDLAVIPAVVLAPLSSIVIYGQPSSGCVLIKVTSEKKKEIRELLKQMEYVNDGKSLWRLL
jgi:uncharacterized protein (UPF0218 family)